MYNTQNLKRNVFVKLFIFLLILSGFCLAQEVDFEKEKAEIKKLDDRWTQMLIEQNLDILKEFYPDNYTEYSYMGFKEYKGSYQKAYDDFAKQFKNVKYLNISIQQEPEIYFSNDGKAAWYYAIYDFKQLIKKTKKIRNFSIAQLSVLIKKDGKWLIHSNMQEFGNEKKEVKIEKSILEQYTGKYQTDDGRIFEVTTDGTQLIFKNENGDEHKYSAQSEYVFFQEDTSGTLVFGRDKNGKVSHYSSFWNGSFNGTRKRIE